MKIVGLFFEYDGDDKKAAIVIFIHSMHEKTIMLDTNSDVFADIIKSIMKKYSDINRQMEGSGSSFKFASSSNIW